MCGSIKTKCACFARYKDRAVKALAENAALLSDFLPRGHMVASSVKVSRFGLSEGRLLYTVARQAFAPQSTANFMKTAEAFLGQKADALLPWIAQCDIFHFGFDPAATGDRLPVRKVYLELTSDTPDDPMLTYFSLKCHAGHLRINRYHTIPMTTPREAAQLLARLHLDDAYHTAARALTSAILDETRDCATLLVTEDGTKRCSLDFNFADAAVSDQIIAALALNLRRLGQSDKVIDRLLARPLSHAALGVLADGAPFVTLYGFPEAGDA